MDADRSRLVTTGGERAWLSLSDQSRWGVRERERLTRPALWRGTSSNGASSLSGATVTREKGEIDSKRPTRGERRTSRGGAKGNERSSGARAGVVLGRIRSSYENGLGVTRMSIASRDNSVFYAASEREDARRGSSVKTVEETSGGWRIYIRARRSGAVAVPDRTAVEEADSIGGRSAGSGSRSRTSRSSRAR